jgi:hypothetical protein
MMKKTLLSVVLIACLTGCALVGRFEEKDSVRYGLLAASTKQDYLFAVYDGDVPVKDSFALIQLWSHKKKPIYELEDPSCSIKPGK